MADDLVLPMLKEMRKEFRAGVEEVRDEARAFRKETNANFLAVLHRLNLVETRLTSVETRLKSVEKQMAALLLVVPFFRNAWTRLKPA